MPLYFEIMFKVFFLSYQHNDHSERLKKFVFFQIRNFRRNMKMPLYKKILFKEKKKNAAQQHCRSIMELTVISEGMEILSRKLALYKKIYLRISGY